jgi:hypothetical protein
LHALFIFELVFRPSFANARALGGVYLEQQTARCFSGISIAKEAHVAIKLTIPSPALVVACIALLVALGPAVYAANTIGSSDIIDGQVKTEDLAHLAVTHAKLGLNSVHSENVLDHSLTAADLKGANVNGALLNFSAGAVVNGRCADFTLDAPGAARSDVVILSLMASAPEGMVFSGVRAVANRVLLKVCNLTGGPSPAISSLPVRVLTIG